MHTDSNAKIRFCASDMILNVHSDASFQTKGGAKSRAGKYVFLGIMTKDVKQIKLKGNMYVLSTMLKLVAVSASEAESGALFTNT